ncbi:DUF92 domain-containing protein [Tepidibacillus decaturensis]|uniref:DUF92 domain-containing protein n=1 Tax=Tepidibacillus decaturensis TaxID=1413211 RepID=A0A135L628_9BACI|nr:DUF92 domain-containing protein [Tepidibacillus decaturensis]KXG44359.1 hypothetical protein U473_10330 [Tepidibacillus decaturensis]
MKMLVLGFFFSTIFGYIGYKKQALSKSGVMGAILTGTAIFGFGQKLSWYLLIIFFFASSSLLSFYRKREKDPIAEVFEKTGKRDVWQALANGGWAAVLTMLGYFLQKDWIYIGFVATIATVNADTWATEIGVLSKTRPRFILNGKRVEKGTSGAVSALGVVGSISGSFFISIIALLLLWIEHRSLLIGWLPFLLITGLSGVAGALFDSVLGATVQEHYLCQVCKKVTERKEHCHKKTIHHHGWRWMNNDLVNFVSSVFGSGLAILLSMIGRFSYLPYLFPHIEGGFF